VTAKSTAPPLTSQGDDEDGGWRNVVALISSAIPSRSIACEIDAAAPAGSQGRLYRNRAGGAAACAFRRTTIEMSGALVWGLGRARSPKPVVAEIDQAGDRMGRPSQARGRSAVTGGCAG